MSDPYPPASQFLRAIIAEDVPVSGGEFADANLQRLIEMTRDKDQSNRDWATMLLAHEDTDTPEVRDALLRAATDDDNVVRAEALSGLAKRDKALALPLIKAELLSDVACMPLFEAAETIADPTLVPFLTAWTGSSDNAFLDRCAQDALIACQNGKSVAQP